ncbi:MULTISPECIES: dephospho-CoA kinase [Legionella]|uniref:dephospho-CoA kinase n=1 Tax=Legionella TaxID=445 RepID=UPI000F8C45C5|nr:MULTISPECIES: dephospho-CoA kinase [Legionella]MCP0914427.1 dephospho-CoA kinase [Legionella sp. 27cVA30]RUR10519.1 dephospho-CoA kinase [Legionella septentrionalis]
MYCIGLSGGIASGKSTVARYFSELGVQVISADEIARQITAPNQAAYHKIVQHFGKHILDASGALNRRQLRQIIFNQASQRQWLENLLHPLIRQQIEKDVASCRSAYCIIEIPLLINREAYSYLDRILLVETDRRVQIARITQRDLCTQEEALAILAAQSTPAQYRSLADDILVNHGSLEELKQQITKLHKDYVQYAMKKSAR